MLLAAEARGRRPDAAVAGAVALELVHNFSLVHDDVMDGDEQRRHRPTVWALFGVGQAIVVGDAMLTLSHELLLEVRLAGTPSGGRGAEPGDQRDDPRAVRRSLVRDAART